MVNNVELSIAQESKPGLTSKSSLDLIDPSVGPKHSSFVLGFHLLLQQSKPHLQCSLIYLIVFDCLDIALQQSSRKLEQWRRNQDLAI